jgi:hypothetical protein
VIPDVFLSGFYYTELRKEVLGTTAVLVLPGLGSMGLFNNL